MSHTCPAPCQAPHLALPACEPDPVPLTRCSFLGSLMPQIFRDDNAVIMFSSHGLLNKAGANQPPSGSVFCGLGPRLGAREQGSEPPKKADTQTPEIQSISKLLNFLKSLIL